MTIITWPVEVNQTIIDTNFSKTIPSNVISTDTEEGRKVYRRRSSKLPSSYSIMLRLNRSMVLDEEGNTEYSIFEKFVIEELRDGTRFTKFPLPFSFKENGEYQEKTVRFVVGESSYNINKIFGDYVYVTFVLEEVL